MQLSQVQEIEQKVSVLLEWIRTNNIVELVFHRDNMRRELIVLTKKMICFLLQEGELEPSHVALILDGILDHHHDKNRDVRDALYDTLVDSGDKIGRHDLIRQIWGTLRRMDVRKHFCARTIKLLQLIITGCRDHALVLEMVSMLWALVQDTSRAPMEAILQALETLPRVCVAQQLDLYEDVLTIIRSHKGGNSRPGGLQAMRLLNERLQLEKPPHARERMANNLVVAKEIFERELEELAAYKRHAKAARNALGNVERDWNNEILYGLWPHLEAVEQRLHLIGQLLGLARCVPSDSYLEKLWAAVVSPRGLLDFSAWEDQVTMSSWHC